MPCLPCTNKRRSARPSAIGLLFESRHTRQAREQRERQRHDENYRKVLAHQFPEPLGPRLRALSLEYASELDSDETGTNLQLASGLMNLPREVRNMIWIEALGGREIHVIFDIGRYRQVQRGLLSLSLSCRRIYSETIDILYQHNEICFRDTRAMKYFHTSLLPHRFAALRSVCYVWHIHEPPLTWVWSSGNPVEWSNTWDLLATYTQLKRLRVEIRVPLRCNEAWRLGEARLFEETRKIDAKVEVELCVGWQAGDKELGVMCKVTRPDAESWIVRGADGLGVLNTVQWVNN